MIRVLLVDDDALVRSGLRLMLGTDPEIEIVAEAGDGVEVASVAAAARPDVVLMDVRMPRLDGVAATAALTRSPDAPAVLVLTTFGADGTVVAALRAGAVGFLLKDTPPEQIVTAVHRVAAGEPAFSPEVTRRLVALATAPVGAREPGLAGAGRAAEELEGIVPDGSPDGVASLPSAEEARRRMAALTAREREVADAVAEGLANGEIAERLFLSTSSVKSHLSSALTKLDLVNRVQLAILAHTARLP